jgi:hypothetical protein
MQQGINSLLDPVVNFGKVTVSDIYTSIDTEVTLITGDGSKLPNPVTDGSFNLVWFNSSTYSDPADDPYVEIVRCIARVGDTLTLMRGQESTLASNKNIPTRIYRMLLTSTKKTIDDIETESQSKVNDHSTLSTGVHGIGSDTIDGVNARNIAITVHSSANSNVHGSTSVATANTIIQRDSNGRAKIATPSSPDDIATKSTVDTVQTNLITHTDNTIAHGSSGTILGLTTADTRYAPIANGVTNGNSHNHSIGDGAQINHTTLSNIGTNTHAQIDTAISNSTGHIASSSPHSGHEITTNKNIANGYAGTDVNNYIVLARFQPIRTVTTTYTIGTDDYTIVCSIAPTTVVLPSAVNIPGRIYKIKNVSSGTITIATTSSQTIDGSTTRLISTANESITVQSDNLNWIVI